MPRPDRSQWIVIDSAVCTEKELIADLRGCDGDTKKNARLIAAAPELLAALKLALIPLGFFEAALKAIEQSPSLDGISTSCDITVDIENVKQGERAFKEARTAITKAEGK